MKNLNVELKNSSYDIYVESGLLQNIGMLISLWYKGKNIAVVTDRNVDSLYGERLIMSLEQHGYNAAKIVIQPGEQSKSLDALDFVYSELADYDITRNGLVIAFGGGVVGDLTGFAAATFMRGIPYVQIPTTVMSQLDSSIGGKTAVNISAGKNLAGCFYQPKAVYIDTELLGTLTDDVFADGLAEAVKYGAIRDRELFMMLRTFESLADARNNINDVIYRCAAIKSNIVSIDEFDRGERMLLNFGHTIGHGIEKYFEYALYTHGEAVSLGMLMITQKSEALGLTKPGTYEALNEVLAKYKLPTVYNDIDADKLLHYVKLDKKSAEEHINLILLKEIGSAYIHRVLKDEIMSFIK